MATYYIDQVNGKDNENGLSPEKALKNYLTINVQPGDKLCFKCGSFYRDEINIIGGKDDCPVTYTSYGAGEKPTFCGSVDVSCLEDWKEVDKNIWECQVKTNGDAGNFVFNENDCAAALKWHECELCDQGDFWDSRFGFGENRIEETPQKLLLYSEKNPALYYSHIECIPHANRKLGTLTSNIIIDGLRFKNSGVHGLAGQGKNITIRNCSFENIGGCTFNPKTQIRFGNAIEFWVYGENILVENCYFRNVYDSCVTHQGPRNNPPPARNFICRGNIFDSYGMAAFEYRDMIPIDSSFEYNVCMKAGDGFASLGDKFPRSSEIWPQPMGHHIFLWRIDKATEGGNLSIVHNYFGSAPVGAAIYSIISPEPEAQIIIDHNIYTKNETLLNRFNGENFSDFESYRQKTGKDKNSKII